MPRTEWTREQVEDLLKRERFRYQRIALPYGLHTDGKDRSATARQILPEDLTGKTLLDVGCSHGFFCFEAKKRGAARVVGVDVEDDVIRKNKLLADCLGLDVEFRVHNMEKGPIVEEFDYVLCLNVLHHLLNPFSALENLVSIAREKLILEMAAFGGHDTRRLRLPPLSGFLLSRFPIVYVSHSSTSGRRTPKRYYFTPKAVRHILQYHHHVFARVDLVKSEYKDRYIVTAEKQRIGHLVMVAGPTASGKTTFCRALMAGELPAVSTKIGVAGAENKLVYMSPRVATNPGIPKIDTAVYHYDMMRPFMRSARVHERDEALDIFKAATKVTVLTLWTPPQLLSERLKRARKWYQFPTKREKRVAADYQLAHRVIGHYDRWFDYLENAGHQTLVVDQSPQGLRFLSVREWKTLVEPLRNQGAAAGDDD